MREEEEVVKRNSRRGWYMCNIAAYERLVTGEEKKQPEGTAGVCGRN